MKRGESEGRYKTTKNNKCRMVELTDTSRPPFTPTETKKTILESGSVHGAVTQNPIKGQGWGGRSRRESKVVKGFHSYKQLERGGYSKNEVSPLRPPPPRPFSQNGEGPSRTGEGGRRVVPATGFQERLVKIIVGNPKDLFLERFPSRWRTLVFPEVTGWVDVTRNESSN